LARWAIVLGSFAALLAPPALAQGANRYASPSGSGPPATCPADDPCAIADATAGLWAEDGDEILLAPGIYNLAGGPSLGLADAVTVRPADPATRPQILNNGGPGVFSIIDAATLSGLHLEATDVASGVGMVHIQSEAEVRIDRTVLASPGLSNSQAIALRWGGLSLTNSAVRVAGDGSNALEVYTFDPVLPAEIRNSTLITEGANSTAIAVTSPSDPQPQTVEVVNTIARGEGFAIGADDASLGDGANLDVTVRHSNLNAINDPAGDDAVVNLGAGMQSEPPLLADPAAGDFAQLPDSPTIDGGVADPFSGPLDLLGGPRVSGTAIDIGADEFDVLPDGTAPNTTIAKGPKRKQKTKKRRAKARFEFGSTEGGSSFECALDAAAFGPCSSPYAIKVKAKRRAKKHVFLVRATDAAGNVDETPAAYRWKLKRKRKR
jgi:hypothetical protein